MIHLHTLGDTLITVGEKEVRPSAPLVFAALLYLGVERGRRVPRAALQELFFPESDERSGSHSVRQLLYKLRQLGAPVTADDSTVLLQPSSVLDACILDGAPNWSDQEAAIAAFGFVPDYEPVISERFTQWLDRQRTVTASRVRATLIALLLARRTQANWRSVTSVAQSLLSIDSLNEEATLALAEATAAMGSKTKALALLATYESETGAELRVAPALLRRRISENLVEPRAGDASPPPLFGRSDELDAIVRRLTRSSSSQHRVCVVVGEPGIGKSRIVEEVMRTSAVAGIRSFVARCRVHHASRPLSVFFEVVPVLLQSPGALGVNPDSLRYLRQLVHRDPVADALVELADDIERSEVLRRALIDLIDAIRSEQDILFVVEDAHWCDAASLKELSLIASQFGSLPILFTSRSVDCLKSCFGDLAEVLRLTPLETSHMHDMARHLLGDQSEARTQQWCATIASGNPLFLRMLCSHVRQTGSCTVPRDLTTIVASRLELLKEQQLRALQYVALLGSYATLASLQDLLGVPTTTFIDCVAHLEDQGYLIERDNRIALNHDLVSEAALGLSPPLTRRALHAHVASFFEKSFDETGNTTMLWDCAEQWRLSGDLGRSIGLLRRCAAHASTLGQSSKALDILSHASTLTSDAQELSALLTEMMLAAKAAGQLNDVLAIKKRLTPITNETHSDAELIGIEAEWLLNGALDAEVLLKCASSLDVATHHRFEACLLLQRYAHESCDEALAERAFGAVKDKLFAADPQERLLVELVYHATFGDSKQGIRAIDELIALAPKMSNVGDQLRAARNIVVGLLIIGRPAEAIALAENYRKRAIDLGLHTRQYEFTGLLSACHMATKDFASGGRWLSEMGAPPDSRWLNLYRQLSLELSLWQSNTERAKDLLEALETSGYDAAVRNRPYLIGARLRLEQMATGFVCSDEEFRDYLRVYEKTKRFVIDDDFVAALVEDLRRRQQPREALQMLDEYVNDARRQSWMLPASFEALRSNLLAALGIASAA